MAERSLILTDHEITALQRRLNGQVEGLFQLSRAVKRPKWATSELSYYEHGRQLTVEKGKAGYFCLFAPLQPGDVARVREKYRAKAWNHDARYDVQIQYGSGGDRACSSEGVERFLDSCLREWEAGGPDNENLRWRSPATMPAWASRYWLPIVSVRCELVDGKWYWVYEVGEARTTP